MVNHQRNAQLAEIDHRRFEGEVATALIPLGRTCESVAAALRAAGIKGFRRIPAACPIAAFLMHAFPGRRFSVVQTRVKDFYGRLYVSLPRWVADFIVKFDQGEYPDLVATLCNQ